MALATLETASHALQAVLTPKERRLRLSIAVVPLVVFLIAMSARLIYLQVCRACSQHASHSLI
jgi:hypothetical protein